MIIRVSRLLDLLSEFWMQACKSFLLERVLRVIVETDQRMGKVMNET